MPANIVEDKRPIRLSGTEQKGGKERRWDREGQRYEAVNGLISRAEAYAKSEVERGEVLWQ